MSHKEQKEFLYIGVLDEISLNKAFEIIESNL